MKTLVACLGTTFREIYVYIFMLPVIVHKDYNCADCKVQDVLSHRKIKHKKLYSVANS